MKEAPTLADVMIRELSEPYLARCVEPELKIDIARSRKFILDDGMSAFLADLAYASLSPSRNVSKNHQLMDSMRTMARLPHAITWVEFNYKRRSGRAQEEYDAKLEPGRGPNKMGWLIKQHPQVETAFICTPCLSASAVDESAAMNGPPTPGMLSLVWRTDDGVLPWKIDDHPNSELSAQIATGISGYRTKLAGYVLGPISRTYLEEFYGYDGGLQMMINYLSETASEIRYIWAFLSTLNDVPTTIDHVRQAKGQMMRGGYRRFVDHSIVRLKIPQKITTRVLARHVAKAARRRRGPVRGHWRADWRTEVASRCAIGKHTWTAVDEGQVGCVACGVKAVWITEHERGDASLGYVLRDYSVTHEKEPTREA